MTVTRLIEEELLERCECADRTKINVYADGYKIQLITAKDIHYLYDNFINSCH